MKLIIHFLILFGLVFLSGNTMAQCDAAQTGYTYTNWNYSGGTHTRTIKSLENDTCISNIYRQWETQYNHYVVGGQFKIVSGKADTFYTVDVIKGGVLPTAYFKFKPCAKENKIGTVFDIDSITITVVNKPSWIGNHQQKYVSSYIWSKQTYPTLSYYMSHDSVTICFNEHVPCSAQDAILTFEIKVYITDTVSATSICGNKIITAYQNVKLKVVNSSINFKLTTVDSTCTGYTIKVDTNCSGCTPVSNVQLFVNGDPSTIAFGNSGDTITATGGCYTASLILNTIPSLSLTYTNDSLQLITSAGYKWSINGDPINGQSIDIDSLAEAKGIIDGDILNFKAVYGQCDTIFEIVYHAPIVTTMQESETQELSSLGIKIFPNPANQFIQVENRHTGIFELYALNGQLMLSQSIQNSTRIDVSNLPIGLYLGVLTSETSRVSTRLLIQR